jgi:hypothetical protein
MEGEQEPGLETRFTGNALPSFAGGPSVSLAEPSSGDSCSISLTDDDDNEDSYDGNDNAMKGLHESPSDDSPYAQVRASVAPYDDTSLSINTPRMCLRIFSSL